MSTSLQAFTQASQQLNEQLQHAQQQSYPVLFLASGGSALKLLDEIDLKTLTLLADQLTIGVVDERYSPDPKINNFCQLMQTRLFQDCEETGAVFIDTRIQAEETAAALATRWETSLRNWRREHLSGQIIITQGIGPDGHTAGIMPYPENPDQFDQLFNQPAQWVTTYDAGSKNPFPRRVTTTCSFLRQVDISICYATGSEKKLAIEQMIENSGDLATTPARILREMPTVWLYTDQLDFKMTKNHKIFTPKS